MLSARIMTVSAILMALSACGSSSKDSTDTLSPSITNVTPENNANDVSVMTSIDVTFNEDMFPESIENSLAMMKQGSAEVIEGLITMPSSNRINFQANQALHKLTPYTATVSTSITDLSGNKLNQAHQWVFTTQDGEWAPEVLLETSSDNVNEPALATDRVGNTLVVWAQSVNGTDEILTTYYHAETEQWSVPTKLDRTIIGTLSGVPKVRSDAQNNLWVLWSQNNTIHYSLLAKYYNVSTQQWSEAINIGSETLDTQIATPDIIFDDHNNGIAVWSQKDELTSVRDIWVNQYAAENNSWGVASKLETHGEDAYDPVVAVNKQGHAIVTWLQETGGINDVWANRYDATTNAWKGAEKIETEAGVAGRTINPFYNNANVALDNNGNGIAVWSQEKNGTDSIWSNRYDAATNSWGIAELIESDENHARAPIIDIDENGNALVLWYQPKSSGQNDVTRFAYYNAIENTWDNAADLESGDITAGQYSQQIEFDQSGNALAAWKQADIDGDSVRAMRYLVSTKSWSEPEKISSTSLDVEAVKIKIDHFGNGWVIREQADTTQSGAPISLYATQFH